MLYLIRTFKRKGTFLKVGYTGDLDGRMRTYLTDNPGYELLSTREGDLTEETRLHLYLTACNLKAGFLDEWFLDIPETLQGFHQSRSKMNKQIWNQRELAFGTTALDFSRRTPKVLIYEDLRFIFRNSKGLGNTKIDKDWKEWNLKESIKARQKLLEEGWIFRYT